jgi:hypothetical protein
MQRSLIALVALVPLWTGFSVAADAKANVQLFFGIPYYSEQIGPDYRYHNGRGWYRERYNRPVYRDRISCGEARQIVRENGYRNVSIIKCSGRTYTFNTTRQGRDVVVYVNSRTGAVWRR